MRQLPNRQKKDFNPRSHEGSDVCFSVYNSIKRISIHAPVKGATRRGICNTCTTGNFNPRSREGSDFSVKCQDCVVVLFQSTLPRRERPCEGSVARPTTRFQSTLPRRERPGTKREMLGTGYFNPRSREGSDFHIRL